MAKIIRFRGDAHRQTQANLPWYVTGQLADEERLQVEEHVSGCACCRADLESERRLADEVFELPLTADAGWAELQRQMGAARTRPTTATRLARRESAPRLLGKMTWLIVAQAAVLALFVYTMAARPATGTYHTLSAPSVARPGNVIVLFRPGISEENLRTLLTSNHARIVDGPTASGAFALRVPEDQHSTIVSHLQKQAEIILAQPIDSSSAP